MKSRHRMAVELMLTYPDTTVAEMLGVRLSTLRRWMNRREIADLMRERETEQKRQASRIARQAVLNAAAALSRAFEDSPRSDAKLLLDVLKCAGAFEAEAEDPGTALAEVLRRAREATNGE